MKTHITLLAIATVLATGMVSCSGSDSPTAPDHSIFHDELRELGDRVSDESLVVPFVGPRGIEVGQVAVSNDDAQMQVEIVTQGGWELHTSLLAAGRTPGDLPFGGQGGLQPAPIADHQVHSPPVTSAIHTLDWVQRGFTVGDTVCLAVHGRVVLRDAAGRSRRKTEAWGEGLDIPGPGAAMYFLYVLQETIPSDPCTIEVTRPNDAEFLCLGDFEEIHWVSTGDCAQDVTIQLYQDGILCQTIAESTPNTGSFDWQVEQICDGDPFSYTVRIVDPVSGIWDESDEAFSIEDCGGGGEKR